MSYRLIFAALLTLLTQQATAEQVMMARVQMSFPEAMLKLQETIKERGYTVSRVQRVDIGLTKSGYKTDKYRVVFFGKPEENARLVKQFPVLSAYFPLKIAIFAEDKDTMITTYDPWLLFSGTDQQLDTIAKVWRNDLEHIFKTMRELE